MCRACSGIDLPSVRSMFEGYGLVWAGMVSVGGGYGLWAFGGVHSLLMESANLFRRHDYVIHGKHP